VCEGIRAKSLKNKKRAACVVRIPKAAIGGRKVAPEIGSKKMEIGNKERKVKGSVLEVRYLNIKNRG